MIHGIIGKKLGMTQVFKEDGRMEAVTVIESQPCTVVSVKTEEKEGYNAAQLGYQASTRKNAPKGSQRFLRLREFAVDDAASVEKGQQVDVSLFHVGELVNVTGISKGKGFAGGVKRHHFAGGPKTHGQSDRHRAPGSVGPGTTPGRVYKGMRMAGHMGAERSTVLSLEVIEADPNRNLLVLKGAVPGARNGLVMIKKAAKRKK